MYNQFDFDIYTNYPTDIFQITLDDYLNQVADSVSNYLIQCSTKIRILQDSYSFEVDDPDYCPDKEAYERVSDIAKCIEGVFKPSIRECCNKVIHALSFELDLNKDQTTGYNYWSGKCNLKGKFGKKHWHIQLNVIQYSLALRYFIDTLRHL